MVMPKWIFNLPLNKISKHASSQGIDPCLVASIVMVESEGVPEVTRYEPNWRHFKDAEKHSFTSGITEETEKIHQATSWGIMQVMGAVARELKFDGSLPELIDIDKGLYVGCAKLRQLLNKHGSENIKDAIAAYNAGSPQKNQNGSYINQGYVDKVMKFYTELKGFKVVV